MDTRAHNQRLEMEVLRALLLSNSEGSLIFSISATSNGSVCLRGTIPSQSDRRAIERIVSEVPGVHQVLCNIEVR